MEDDNFWLGVWVVMGIALILIINKIIKTRSRKKLMAGLAKQANIKHPITKSKIKRGTFEITGYHHLPEDSKKVAWKELKVGDTVTLIPDPKNKHDKTAIKVTYNNIFIGWVSKHYRFKPLIFKTLMDGKPIECTCKTNYRKGDYIRAEKPNSKGEYEDKYLGMAQFIEVEYKYMEQ